MATCFSADLLFSPSNSPDRQQNKSGGDEKKNFFKLPKGVRVGREIAFTLCSALLLARTLYTSKFIVQKIFKTAVHF